MNKTWKLPDLASGAEVIAAVGVIVSLVFVGYQIKDGNQEARAATLQAASDSEMFVQSQFLRYADTWAKIVAGSPLSEGRETQKGLTLFNMLMTLNENRFHQTKSGFLDQYLINIDITLDFPFYEIWR